MNINIKTWPFYFEEPPTVYLNGTPLTDIVTEADDTVGYVIVAETDLKGDIVTKDGHVVHRKLTGRVHIDGKRR